MNKVVPRYDFFLRVRTEAVCAGKITSLMFVPSYSNKADFFSTVTPGQLPTHSLVPAIAFIRVDLPDFGLPATATVMVFFS